MTTFVDPLGITASITAAISGKTGIAALSITSSAVTPIPHDAGWMIAVLTATSDNAHAELPSGAAVGDICEVHLVSPNHTRCIVDAPSGETIIGNSATQVSLGVGRMFRKVDSTTWSAVGPSDGNS
jgi:hypothetical protein